MAFLYAILCLITCRLCADVLHIRRLLYYKRCQAGCEIWMTTYASRQASQSFLGKPFVCIQLYLRHLTWKLQVICGRLAYWTTANYWKHYLCGLELHEKSYWRAMVPDTHCSLSGTTLCAYTASLYIHSYFICYYAWQQNSHILWLYTCTTHQTTVYCQLGIVLQQQSWLPTLHIAVFFQLIAYANIKITIRGTCYHTSLQVCCIAAKKGTQTRG